MQNLPPTRDTVRAVHCDYRASDEEIYQALKRATDPLTRAWDRLARARRIAIKFNQDGKPGHVPEHAGQRMQLVSDQAARALLRLLRERTQAELVAVDISVDGARAAANDGSNVQLAGVLAEFNVPFIECIQAESVWVDVPGGGAMFDRYPLPRAVVEADEFISAQKIKNHGFMGVTLALKNLFGLAALLPGGRPRTYYHHLVRMPYMLTDLGRLLDPALNILDGLVTQAGWEWGPGDQPRICNTLIAGDNPVSTDACATHLMGHNPQDDWLTPPFHRDRNALKVAAEAGYGTVDLARIDFASEVSAPIGHFYAHEWDTRETIISWRRTTSQQALFFREHQAELTERYAGQYILLQMGEVRWSSAEGEITASRRILSGDHPDEGMWLKYVTRGDEEGEHFEVYEQTLAQMKSMGLA